MSAAKVTKGTIYITMQTAIQYFTGMLFYMIIARILTQDDIGAISLLMFILTLFSTVVPLALPIATAKYVSEFTGRNERDKAASVASTVIKLVLVLSASALIMACLLSSWFSSVLLGGAISVWLFILTCTAAFFSALRLSHLGLLQGLQRFDRYAIVGLSTIISSRLLGAILILSNRGLTGVAIGWLVGEALGLFIAMGFCHGSFPKPKDPYDLRLLFAFSLPVFVMATLNVVSGWADRMLFLFLTSDFAALGVYHLAVQGATTLSVVWIAVSATILPAFSELYGRVGRASLTEAVRKMSRYLAYLIFPAAFGLAAISKTAMALLWGWEYAAGSLCLAILALFTILFSFGMGASSALQAIGETKVFIKIALTTVVVNIVMVTTLTPVLGVLGATAARATMMTVNFVYTFHELKRRIEVKVDKEALWKALLASLIMAVPLGVFEALYAGVLFESAFVGAAVEISAGAAIYGLALLLLRAPNRQDFDLLRQVSPKFLLKALDLLERISLR